MTQTTIDHRGMDKVKGDIGRFPELVAIVDAIFGKVRIFTLPDGTRCQTKVMASGSVLGVDRKGCRYVEQNRNKRSPEGARARAGAHIVWVIRTHDNNGRPLNPNQWIGKIEDGTVRMK